jgi:H/ACA ribonucleoprotein complex subunit 3
MTYVYINGRRIQLQSGMAIGKGGEADIYKLDPSTVLKLYKRPTDPDYEGNADAQLGAKTRIAEQQHKLPAFPTTLPREVVVPTALAYDKMGSQIVGYTMPYVDGMEVLMRLGDRQYRETGGIDANQVVKTFHQLHGVVSEVHAQGVVIGDFNDLNVLANSDTIRIVDADSMQFSAYYCHTFTNRFVDPLLCGGSTLMLARPHNEQSDWYAYFVMLLQSLLYVGPYGGVHRPAHGKKLQFDARVLHRLTVLDSDVIYPKPAMPLQVLPDDVLEYMESVFKNDKREVFPLRLLDGLRWTTCVKCGNIHARRVCPNCSAPGAPKQTVTIRGTVTARRVFQTSGRLLHVVNQEGKLHYLYYENGTFYREAERALFSGDLSPELRFRIQAGTTLVGKNGTLLSIDEAGTSQRLTTDMYHQTLPIFDANARHAFWVTNGQLLKSDRLGPSYIGDVLSGQTLFWTGAGFGFGFYQAGQLTRAFTFKSGVRGINDQVDIASIPGQLVDATCIFSETQAWFMTTSQEHGELVHRCYVLDEQGHVLAESSAKQGEDTWLGHGIRGHLAVGSSLYVATNDGIVRVGIDEAAIVQERLFPDTEPFVDTHTQLVAGPGGIYAVSTREITLLEIR